MKPTFLATLVLSLCVGSSATSAQQAQARARATASGGQKLGSKVDLTSLHKLPAFASLIQYLRCEADTINQFGESKPPLDALSLIPEDALTKQPLRLEVWPNIVSEVNLFATYGASAIWQNFRVEDKQKLLQAITAAGWNLRREPLNSIAGRNDSIVESLIGTYVAERPMPGQPNRTRTLLLSESKFSVEMGEVSLNGLSLVCTYSKPMTSRANP